VSRGPILKVPQEIHYQQYLTEEVKLAGMSTPPVLWPLPQDLFSWIGEPHLSRDEDNPDEVVAIMATTVREAYEKW